ncbi:MAG: glycosyltransferase [Pirellulales bacterium]|nr:glycosyltransferase [Pirellulales bacterium]
MANPRFSICIPNFNYEKYLGRTIQSVLDQTFQDFEILVSDNASTDRSVEVVRSFAEPRIKLHVNQRNVGFAGNLDRAARMATGRFMIMLSSDDLMRRDALEVYARFFSTLGDQADATVISSNPEVIDPDDRVTGRVGIERAIWQDSDRDAELEHVCGGTTFKVEARPLLKRCLLTLKNPLFFACTCYPRALYERVEGYGGGRLINPDKWFNWKLLSAGRAAAFLDRPLFAYRVHPSNQNSLQTATAALKYMTDQYVSTLEIDNAWLKEVGLERPDVERAFVEYDVARHGLATLARGERARARRMLTFGQAVYPWHMRGNRRARALRVLLALGPLGQAIAAGAYRRYRAGAGEESNGQ